VCECVCVCVCVLVCVFVCLCVFARRRHLLPTETGRMQDAVPASSRAFPTLSIHLNVSIALGESTGILVPVNMITFLKADRNRKDKCVILFLFSLVMCDFHRASPASHGIFGDVMTRPRRRD
jgi:hypothetical protein